MIDPTYPFLALLLVYMGYSWWIGLDPRYPIVAALVLLVLAALLDAGGSVGAANDLATYVFFLLAAGVVLLLVDERREDLPGTGTPGAAGPVQVQ